MFSKTIFRGLSFAVIALGLAASALAAPIVYIAGDSTVMTYRASLNLYPQQGWGAHLPEWFNAGISFSNHAIGGRSSRSFVEDGHLQAILDVIQPGDYLLIQFGHNDASSDATRHTDPFTTYKQYLKMYIDGARQHSATPVLITPVGRRSTNSDGTFKNDFPDYCTAMKQLGTETSTPVIDLMSRSISFYNSIGFAATANVHLWLQAGQYPNWPNGVSDSTHFQEYGSVEIARLVKEGIQATTLPLKSFLKSAIGTTYAAESATRSGTGMVLETVNGGYHGTGYVNFPTTGGALTFNNVNGGTGGTKIIRIRFALGITTSRTGQLVVNGVTSNFTCNPTTAWTTWVTFDVSKTLNSGTANTIQLKSTGQDLANIDELTVL
jgi:lysophospholipase L1-like esterase